jgi:hypothetical protein
MGTSVQFYSSKEEKEVTSSNLPVLEIYGKIWKRGV